MGLRHDMSQQTSQQNAAGLGVHFILWQSEAAFTSNPSTWPMPGLAACQKMPHTSLNPSVGASGGFIQNYPAPSQTCSNTSAAPTHARQIASHLWITRYKFFLQQEPRANRDARTLHQICSSHEWQIVAVRQLEFKQLVWVNQECSTVSIWPKPTCTNFASSKRTTTISIIAESSGIVILFPMCNWQTCSSDENQAQLELGGCSK